MSGHPHLVSYVCVWLVHFAVAIRSKRNVNLAEQSLLSLVKFVKNLSHLHCFKAYSSWKLTKFLQSLLLKKWMPIKAFFRFKFYTTFLISNILASLVSIFVYRVKMQLNSKSSSRFLSRLSYLSNVNDSPITLQTKYPSKLTGYKACASLRMNYFIS